jgi:hypothetical protein
MSSKASSRVRGVLRRGPWLEYRGTRDLLISELVVPLRYDVLVRKAFLEAVLEWKERGRKNFAGFVDDASDHPYFTWFRDVLSARTAPDLVRDAPALRTAFERRVRAVVRLCDALEEQGFDTARPLTLHTSPAVQPTASGKLVLRDHYAGDGCHRLAWLLVRGRTWLPASHYRVRRYLKFTPWDNTGVLVRAGCLTGEAYCRYLSPGYAAGPHDSVPSLLRACGLERPTRLRELRTVLAVDRVHA